jgi:hypothetical protein
MVTELERAKIADEVFEAAVECVRESRKLDPKHPARPRLLATGFTILQSMGGAATDYAQNGSIEVTTVTGASERPAMTPEQCDAIIAAYENKVNTLPCSDWSETDKDASPVFENVNTPPTEASVHSENNGLTVHCEKTVPSRMAVDECPTSDGVGPGEIPQSKGTLPWHLMFPDYDGI